MHRKWAPDMVDVVLFVLMLFAVLVVCTAIWHDAKTGGI